METFLTAKPQLTFAPQNNFIVEEITGVAPVRRYALQMAGWLGFNEVDAGRVGIIVSELATNIVKHAGRGELLLRWVRDGGDGLEILALDRGPGIANLEASFRDGVSTAGTAGSGLGAIQRMADDFQVFTQPDKGSVFYVKINAATKPKINSSATTNASDVTATSAPTSGANALQTGPLQIGAICIPKPPEEACGDAWYIDARGDTVLVGVADGLGHGPDAATASRAALNALAGEASLAPGRLIEVAHQRARATRGAAVSFAALQPALNQIKYAGVGNIAASVCSENTRQQLISHNGIVGHNMRKVQEFTLDWPPTAAIVLHSDGISTQWDLRLYPGLLTRHPALIAAVIYRDFCRKTDDATVVVIKRQ
ncbi:MAG: serine/threonine protein kinase [Verrucomicrobiaceae bacterium]|nr:serine/threonine protein kinase [Verrucomicrobiaceae bacterium]